MFETIVASSYHVQYALWIMFAGMGGIFVFMAIFYVLIYMLDKYIKPKANE